MDSLGIHRLRYEFTCRGELRLHCELPTITLRGAFGYALAQVIARRVGIPELENQVAAYRRIFMPQNTGYSTSHNRELSRPFAMQGGYSRPDHRSFLVDIMLFGQAIPYEPIFDETIQTMAEMGLGEQRLLCDARKIASLAVTLPDPEPKEFLAVKFVSPCSRLKSQGKVYQDEIPFSVLFARLLDRVEELKLLYGDNLPPLAYEQQGELKRLAGEIPWKKVSGGCHQVNRISGRTGDSICMDGFQGVMEYQGDFQPFHEYLRYLPYVNLGRFSAFGCGWCKMAYLDREL